MNNFPGVANKTCGGLSAGLRPFAEIARGFNFQIPKTDRITKAGGAGSSDYGNSGIGVDRRKQSVDQHDTGRYPLPLPEDVCDTACLVGRRLGGAF